jgi:hypothetical protein
MQKLVSILFSLLILFQNFNISFEEFSRIGTLLEHAKFHQEQYGDSFFEFLAEHYVDSSYHPVSDHKEHEDLPFKDHHPSCVHGAVVFTITSQDYEIVHDLFMEIPITFYYSDSFSLFEKAAVFQPPKYA